MVKPDTSGTLAQEKYFLVFCILCLHSLLLNKAIDTAKIKYCVHLFFPLLFTATLSKCLHLSCSLYCPDLLLWQRTLCIMQRKAAVCPDNTGMVLGQEMHILMNHQTLTKMCNYFRSPHYAVPPP